MVDLDKENFKKTMRNALRTNTKPISLEENKDKDPISPIDSGLFVSIDLPKKKQKKSGYISCRCTRQTEDTITALMEKTGLSQSEIINHLIEISLPALVEKYLF